MTVAATQVPPAGLSVLAVEPWPDPVIDALGHDPRSVYVERFWLGVLGPSTTWLLRRIAHGFDGHPDGFDMDLAETAAALGLGGRGGRHSPFTRAVGRCCRFDLAELRGENRLAVRRRVPPLSRRQVQRLPAGLAAAHAEWQSRELSRPGPDEQRQRCRRLALSLAQVGEEAEAIERQLLQWRFPPRLARESTDWARARSVEALSCPEG